MHNLVFSPIDPEKLISSISERVTANILKAVQNEQSSTNHPEQLFTIQKASEFLSLSVRTIYGKVSRKEIPFIKKGKRLYFSPTELMDYLKGDRKKSQEEIIKEVDSFLAKKKKPNQKPKK
jgi:excisionase family DNA binding protein